MSLSLNSQFPEEQHSRVLNYRMSEQEKVRGTRKSSHGGGGEEKNRVGKKKTDCSLM